MSTRWLKFRTHYLSWIGTGKARNLKENWEYKVIVGTQEQNRHVIKTSLQLESHRKKKKEFIAILESYNKMYERLEARFDTLQEMVSKLADQLQLFGRPLTSSPHPPRVQNFKPLWSSQSGGEHSAARPRLGWRHENEPIRRDSLLPGWWQASSNQQAWFSVISALCNVCRTVLQLNQFTRQYTSWLHMYSSRTVQLAQLLESNYEFLGHFESVTSKFYFSMYYLYIRFGHSQILIQNITVLVLKYNNNNITVRKRFYD